MSANEDTVETSIRVKSKMLEPHIYSISTRLSRPIPSPTSESLPSSTKTWHEEGGFDTNISNFYSSETVLEYGFSERTPWLTTTNDTVSTDFLEAGSDGERRSNHTDDGAPLLLPTEFTQISQLNKDCITAYAVLFLLGAVGNLLVLYCVSRYDRLGKSRTPLLIMNLCMADLIVTFFLIPTEIFWRLTIAWKGGDILCKLSQFIRAFGMYLSSNVVICISIDRYFAIVYPLKLAGAVRRVKWTLVAAWIVSAIFAGPQVFVYHVATHPEHPEFRQCVTKGFLTSEPYNELIYNVSSVSALYFIPLIVIIYTYTMILCKIHKKSRQHSVANRQQQETIELRASCCQSSGTYPNSLSVPGSTTTMSLSQSEPSVHLKRSSSKSARLMLRTSANQTATLTRARSRTLRLTLTILITFIFCWTPYTVITLWYMLDRTGASKLDERIQETLIIMAVTNSVLNPVIYGTVGRQQDFKKRLNSLFRSFPSLHRFINHTCCGLICQHCCDKGGRRNSETVVVTLNRVQCGGTRQTSVIGCENGYRNSPLCSSRSTLLPLKENLTPSTQIVTIKSAEKSSGNILERLVLGLVKTGSSSSRRSENMYELSCASGGDKNDCIECSSSGATTAAHYVGDTSPHSQTCTQL